MGIVLGRILAARDPRSPPATTDDINLEAHQLGCKAHEADRASLPDAVLGGDVLSFYVATLAQSQLNCLARVDSG